ncbi:amidase domain-containing protein [Hirsutella rhossiliensis]|uniref:Amidase domain-containing protein n=1 Tax=Hirsutella rhossiliensis TaxID=111463 RepID=A0A9P8SLJ6_9HYPO|nr:amidase domain-containing protein [Hirsutella rhossiliensis]KAH0966334.1 amidase domain-containing protein [Hirsutella rhossiliensis]
MGDCNGFQLEEATIGQMQEALHDGRVTSVQLVHCYLKRTFQTRPYLNSVMQENPEIFEAATLRDAERRAGNASGPLHGIPFTIKDNIASNDMMETTAGSWALLGSRPRRDATVLKRLRDAGALLLGKAAMSEWADMRSTNYSEGYSPRGGQCRSAYNLMVNPGGSSSGSAVGVAANAVAFSIGTETDGSVLTGIWTIIVINPAMRNQIVGFKPTVGLTSRAGVIPESEHQDSVGTFGRTVRDAVLALVAIYGSDKLDPYTELQSTLHIPEKSFEKLLSTKEILKEAKFGIPWQSFWRLTDPETRDVLLIVINLLKTCGAEIYNMTEIKAHESIISPEGWDWDFNGTSDKGSEYSVVKVDFYNNINQYLDRLLYSPMRSLRDIVEYNRRYSGSEGGFPNAHPAFPSGQDGLEAALATGGIQDAAYNDALNFRQGSARDGIDAALQHEGKQLNGLLVPLEPGQSYKIAAQAGSPMITLPAGVHKESGMGIGLGIMQAAWKDDELVRWGSAIEDMMSCTQRRRTLPTWRGAQERNLPMK